MILFLIFTILLGFLGICIYTLSGQLVGTLLFFAAGLCFGVYLVNKK
jgi:drug/metabolite transporter (DMT)-like permease